MIKKLRGWKEGIITVDLRASGGGVHKKGSTVRYKLHRVYDEHSYWTGEYEYYYLDTDNYNLIRDSRLYIDT